MILAAISMPNQIANVDPMVLTLKAAACEYLAADKILAFEICTSEALTNAVKHGNGDNEHSHTNLTLRSDADAVTLEIYDTIGAEPFDLHDNANGLPDDASFAESGRGLALILQCADEVRYRSEDGRRRMELVFTRGALK